MNPAPSPLAEPIRAIGPFDLDLVAALHAGCFAEAWDRAAIAALLAMPGAFGLLAADGAAPLGFLLARAAAGEAEILSLGVSLPARRRGWGARLVEAGLDRMAQEGARRIYLEVAEDNMAAIELYRARGFAQIGRRAAYYRSQHGTATGALVLARALDEARA